jgi:hypothetical protein
VTDYTVALVRGPAGKESSGEQTRRLSMAAFDTPIRRIHEPAGAFAFDRLKAGSYELAVTASDGRSGSVIVSLKAGKAIADAAVSATSLGSASRPDAVKTSSDGTFELENIASDQPLRLYASLDGYVSDGRNPRKGTVKSTSARSS